MADIIPNLPPGDPAILTPIIVFILPLISMGIFALPLYLYEKQLSKIREKIFKRFKKYELPHYTLPTLEELVESQRE